MKTTLDELQAFVAVVDSGSLTAAAEHLGLTVSATSRSLARLEDKLATTLLRRTTRRLALTEEGRLFLASARGILVAVDTAEEQLAARRECPAGVLRVDAATPFMLHVLVPLVAGFQARFPHVQLQLHSNEGITDLIEKRTDVAFRIGALKDSSLHARPLGSSRLHILASPGYLAQHGTPDTLDALAGHCLLGFSQPEHLNDWPLRAADGTLLRITPGLVSSSGETLRQLALAGNGVVCLSDFMTAADLRAGTLVALFQGQVQEVRQPVSAVYYRNTALAARIHCFVDYVREQLASCWA